MKLRTIYKGSVFFVILFLTLLHFPVVSSVVVSSNHPQAKIALSNTGITVENKLSAFYDNMQLAAKGLSKEAYEYAIKGFEKLKAQGKLQNENLLTIVDFTKPSNEKRFFVLDMNKGKILFNTWVAHGKNSGEKFARNFSNKPESLQSSLGFYSTSQTYQGKHGYSLKLKGLEPGYNNNAESRAIVVHGANYVSEQFIHTKGFLGRSWGCPAIPEKLTQPIIDRIKNGSCLFVYSGNSGYLQKSKLLNASDTKS